MRYTVFLLAFMLLFASSFATASYGEEPCAEQDVHMGDNPSAMESKEPCEESNMGPWEGMWFDRPWDMWRHVDEGTLDMDAVHYMSDVRTIAILPFVDMTRPTYVGDPIINEAGGTRRIVENLATVLMDRGYLVIPPSDVESVINAYFRGSVFPTELTDETANNEFWFDKLPDRALEFYMDQVDGLEEQRYASFGGETGYSVSPTDIQAISEALGSDCVIRGFVHEFALDEDIDADWRTFIPPFLGFFNPDVRLTVEVAYYIYDGHSGDMIWNGTVRVRHDEEWPIFNSESEVVSRIEMDIAHWFVDRTVPNWMDLVMVHPNWVPFEMWYEMDEMEPFVQHPDWLNPLRHGWHNNYDRSEWRFDLPDPVDNPLQRYRYRDLPDYFDSGYHWLMKMDD